MFAEVNHDGTLRVQKKRRKWSSNEKASSVVEAAKQFLEEVKMEEKEEKPTLDCDIDDGLEKKGNQHVVVENTEDKQQDPNEGSVACNEIVEDNHQDPNEGSVTCNKVAEDGQCDHDEVSVTFNEIVEVQQQHDHPNEGSMPCNEVINPADGKIAEPSNGESAKEQVINENEYGEKSEPPSDFLSGTVYHCQAL